MARCSCGKRVRKGAVGAVFAYTRDRKLIKVICSNCAAFRKIKYKTFKDQKRHKERNYDSWRKYPEK